MLADEVDNALAIDMCHLASRHVLLQVELYISLLEVMVVHFNVPTHLLAAHVQVPVGEPLSAPVVGEVQVVAGYVHGQLVVASHEYAVLGRSLPELPGDVGVHGHDGVVPELHEVCGEAAGGVHVDALLFDLGVQGQGVEGELDLLDWVVIDEFLHLRDHWFLVLLLLLLLIVIVIVIVVLIIVLLIISVLVIVVVAVIVVIVIVVVLVVVGVGILVVLVLLLPWLLLLLDWSRISCNGILSAHDIDDNRPIFPWQLQVILMRLVVLPQRLLGLMCVQPLSTDNVRNIVQNVLLLANGGVLDAEFNDFLGCCSTHILLIIIIISQ